MEFKNFQHGAPFKIVNFQTKYRYFSFVFPILVAQSFVYPVGGTKPGLLAEDITKLLVCRQTSDNDSFESTSITNVELEKHKKQINVDYFFQNDLHKSSESKEQGLDVHDFHVAVHCQGQFAIRPYGTSTQVFRWAVRGEESQDVTVASETGQNNGKKIKKVENMKRWFF